MEDNSDYQGKADAGEETRIAIEGMQMLNRHCKEMNTDSMHEDAKLGGEEEGGDNKGELDPVAIEAEMAHLTKNMNVAMANLHIYLSEGEQDKDVRINMLSDDKGGEDFLEEGTSMLHYDLTLFSKDYDSFVNKVSSGVFDAAHSIKFEEPDNFKRHLWNKAGPSAESMTILLGLLRDELGADQVGLPADFSRLSLKMSDFMVEEAGEDQEDQIDFINLIAEELQQIGQIDPHNKAYSLDEGPGQLKASKTQGMLPGAHEASPMEEAAIEPAITAGRDKEGVQSLSMATPG